jgi:nitrogen-specific signal transduction histidine kinase
MMNESEIKQLAHDLRNELSSIYGYAQILETSFNSPDTQKELEISQAIGTCVKKMTVLITEQMDS